MLDGCLTGQQLALRWFPLLPSLKLEIAAPMHVCERVGAADLLFAAHNSGAAQLTKLLDNNYMHA